MVSYPNRFAGEATSASCTDLFWLRMDSPSGRLLRGHTSATACGPYGKPSTSPKATSKGAPVSSASMSPASRTGIRPLRSQRWRSGHERLRFGFISCSTTARNHPKWRIPTGEAQTRPHRMAARWRDSGNSCSRGYLDLMHGSGACCWRWLTIWRGANPLGEVERSSTQCRSSFLGFIS
jgi:hypothetical protein